MTWDTREVNSFVNDINSSDYEDEAKEFNKIAELVQLVFEDAWLARAYFWGTATAMENQIAYLGDNMLSNMERRLNQLVNPTGILAEDDLRTSRFSNESLPHINEDQTVEDRAEELRLRIDQIIRKMNVAGVQFCIAVQNHDDISKTLEQMTFAQIKAKASLRRTSQPQGVASQPSQAPQTA